MIRLIKIYILKTFDHQIKILQKIIYNLDCYLIVQFLSKIFSHIINGF